MIQVTRNVRLSHPEISEIVEYPDIIGVCCGINYNNLTYHLRIVRVKAIKSRARLGDVTCKQFILHLPKPKGN